ncbi:MAG: energy-coupling factor ABC transporter ATP-binding protein [Erysipelotrichaceae bacterium]|nr:energy-coupling factor ABC transporter ATP-binding protein [Erysipelotrichaceae bacterium]
MNTILEVKNLGFKYQLADKPIFKNLNFKVNKGEFIGLVGKNGVGKTTLCNILRGIIPEFIKGEIRGDVIIDGKNLNEYSRGVLAEKIGFVFQNPFIQISGIKKTVFDEIAFGLENLGIERDEMIERTNKILKQLKIEYLKDKHPTQLSGGQSQRVALASVLVMEPEIILVDEPTSQLDPIGTEEVFETLGILKEQNCTVILVEHKIDLICEYADRVIVMNDGGIVMDGKTDDIMSNPIVENYGVPMSKVSKLAYLLSKQNDVVFDKIPTNVDEAINQFRKGLNL